MPVHPAGCVDQDVTLSSVFTVYSGHGVLRIGTVRGTDGQTELKSVLCKELFPVVVLKVECIYAGETK